MGTCSSRNDNASLTSRCIDQQLKKHSQAMHQKVKMLLLGPGESGKSTVFKQMKIIQNRGGFSPEELTSFIKIVHSNCLSQMCVLVKNALLMEVPLSAHAKSVAEKFLQLGDNNTFTPEIAQMIKILWEDKGIQRTCHERANKFPLNDTAEYFFKDVERFAHADYIPTTEDVLRSRVRSTGIEEAEFTFENLTFTMVDVGGQRSERRKWIHCFSNVTAVLFVAALSAYDQTLREDNSQNTMAEALLLFQELAKSNYFPNSSIILFLNKTDLFEKKIQEIPLNVCFDDYHGALGNVVEAQEFIKKKFFQLSPTGDVYTHFTCALNTTNVQYVISAIRHRLMNGIISEIGVGI